VVRLVSVDHEICSSGFCNIKRLIIAAFLCSIIAAYQPLCCDCIDFFICKIVALNLYVSSSYMRFLIRNDLTILLRLYFFSLPLGKTLWYPLFVMAMVGMYLLVKEIRDGSFS
jgi:hypothetical protein